MTLGATPLGANNENNEEDASRNIRRMFGEVAPRYDLLNRLLSLYIEQISKMISGLFGTFSLSFWQISRALLRLS